MWDTKGDTIMSLAMPNIKTSEHCSGKAEAWNHRKRELQ